MPPSPVPADPGWDEDLAWLDRDPEREHWLARAREHDEPLGEDEEFEDFAPLTAEELAEIDEAAADELLAAKAASTGRRGPGQPGSARTFPGESSSPAAAFGPGMPLDVLPGCAGLAVAADAAAGEDGRFGGVSEAELVGVMCGWDRVEAHAHARKLAAVAELARRNPGELDAEFTRDQVAYALGESRARADSLIGMAQALPRRLPGTKAGLEDGTISRYKAEIIAGATALLDDAEAAAAEAKVLDRATGHGCARPEFKGRRKRAGPGPPGTGFIFTPASRDGPDGYGTWRLHTPGAGPDLIVTLESFTTDPCAHRYQARGHDPGATLRHLSQIRHATCTSPVCHRPASQCDHEHNIPYEAGGRTCLCNTGPKCRHDHRLKQHPRWTVDQLPDGTFRWTTPAGRHYTAEPTRYPI